MTAGWVNLKARAEQVRAMERAQREKGYSDGYALLRCASPQIDYAQGWRRGREARLNFGTRGDAA